MTESLKGENIANIDKGTGNRNQLNAAIESFLAKLEAMMNVYVPLTRSN